MAGGPWDARRAVTVEAWRSGQISPDGGRRAGRTAAGSVGVGAVFAFELVGAAGGDLPAVEVAVMAWSRRRVVAVISGRGRAGQYQLPSARMAPPVLAWMPGWSIR